MRRLPNIIITISALCVAGLMLVSCDRTREMRGYDFMPDMVYSRAYETFSENPNFTDSMTMRVPVLNSVPAGFLPFRYTIDPEERIKAGTELQNPFLQTPEVVARGELIFTTFCIGCHGKKGLGDGQLYASGLYPLKPRTLAGKIARNLKDGEIFHTITIGFGSMGAHGSQIRPEDRWKLVKYVRKLQENALTTGDTASVITPGSL
jgi:mono/diheme cytochrome c family protein